MKGNDILSVVFLSLIFIIISGLIRSIMPNNLLLITSFSFMSVALWVAYDFMLLKRYEAKEKCLINQYEHKIKKLKHTHKPVHDDNHYIPNTEHHKPTKKKKLKKRNKGEVDIDIYDKQLSIKDTHESMGSSGDNRLFNRMKYMAMQPKLATDIRAKWNKYKLQPYLEEELREHSNRTWWNSDHLDDEF